MLLEDARKEIDIIDKQLTLLFLKRMDIVKNVAEYKISHNMEVLQPEREVALLEKLTKDLSTQESESVRKLYQAILELSRSSQQEIIDSQKK